MKSTSLKKKLFSILRIALPLAVFTWLVSTIDLAEAKQTVENADNSLLLLGGALACLSVLLQGARWCVLLRATGYHVPITKITLINFRALSFDSFIPGRLGSETFRILSLHKTVPFKTVLGSLIFLRLQTLLVGAPIALVGFLLISDLFSSAVTKGILVVVSVGVIGFALSHLDLLLKFFLYISKVLPSLFSKIAAYIGDVLEVIGRQSKAKFELMLSTLVMVTWVVVNILLFMVVGKSFGMDLAIYQYVCVVPILLFSANIPITIQGRGLIELIAIYFWMGDRASKDQIVLTCIAIFGYFLILSIIAALSLLRIKNKDRPSNPDPSEPKKINELPL